MKNVITIFYLNFFLKKNDEEIKELNDDLKKLILSKENNKLYY